MLLKLNEDCLEEIYKNLNLEDQFALRRVSSFFKNFIERMWRRTYKYVNTNPKYVHSHNPNLSPRMNARRTNLHFGYIIDHKTEYQQFMIAIRESLVQLEIYQRAHILEPDQMSSSTQNMDAVERLSCLVAGISPQRKFPEVKTLKCSLDFDLPDAIDFSTAFPALLRFELCWFSFGRFKPSLSRLEQSLTTIARCDRLKELFLNVRFLTTIIDEIPTKMSMRLRQLAAFNCDYHDASYDLLRKIITNSALGQRVHTLSFDYCLNVPKCINIFVEQYPTTDPPFFTMIHAPSLRQLYWTGGGGWHELNMLNQIIRDLPALEQLHYCNISKEGVDAARGSRSFTKFIRSASDIVHVQNTRDRRRVGLNIYLYVFSKIRKNVRNYSETTLLPDNLNIFVEKEYQFRYMPGIAFLCEMNDTT